MDADKLIQIQNVAISKAWTESYLSKSICNSIRLCRVLDRWATLHHCNRDGSD